MVLRSCRHGLLRCEVVDSIMQYFLAGSIQMSGREHAPIFGLSLGADTGRDPKENFLKAHQQVSSEIAAL